MGNPADADQFDWPELRPAHVNATGPTHFFFRNAAAQQRPLAAVSNLQSPLRLPTHLGAPLLSQPVRDFASLRELRHCTTQFDAVTHLSKQLTSSQRYRLVAHGDEEKGEDTSNDDPPKRFDFQVTSPEQHQRRTSLQRLNTRLQHHATSNSRHAEAGGMRHPSATAHSGGHEAGGGCDEMGGGQPLGGDWPRRAPIAAEMSPPDGPVSVGQPSVRHDPAHGARSTALDRHRQRMLALTAEMDPQNRRTDAMIVDRQDRENRHPTTAASEEPPADSGSIANVAHDSSSSTSRSPVAVAASPPSSLLPPLQTSAQIQRYLKDELHRQAGLAAPRGPVAKRKGILSPTRLRHPLSGLPTSLRSPSPAAASPAVVSEHHDRRAAAGNAASSGDARTILPDSLSDDVNATADAAAFSHYHRCAAGARHAKRALETARAMSILTWHDVLSRLSVDARPARELGFLMKEVTQVQCFMRAFAARRLVYPASIVIPTVVLSTAGGGAPSSLLVAEAQRGGGGAPADRRKATRAIASIAARRMAAQRQPRDSHRGGIPLPLSSSTLDATAGGAVNPITPPPHPMTTSSSPATPAGGGRYFHPHSSMPPLDQEALVAHLMRELLLRSEGAVGGGMDEFSAAAKRSSSSPRRTADRRSVLSASDSTSATMNGTTPVFYQPPPSHHRASRGSHNAPTSAASTCFSDSTDQSALNATGATLPPMSPSDSTARFATVASNRGGSSTANSFEFVAREQHRFSPLSEDVYAQLAAAVATAAAAAVHRRAPVDGSRGGGGPTAAAVASEPPSPDKARPRSSSWLLPPPGPAAATNESERWTPQDLGPRIDLARLVVVEAVEQGVLTSLSDHWRDADVVSTGGCP